MGKNQIRRYRWFIEEAKAQRFPNGKKLAKEFNIHRNQAQKDISDMKYHEVFAAPLEYSYFEKGYFHTNDKFQYPGVWIKDEELFLFALAKEVLKDKSSKKILDHLFEELSSGHSSVDLKKINNRIYIKSTGSYISKSSVLQYILNGILENSKIDITYIPVYGESTLFTIQVSPIYLLYYKSNWYLLARYKNSFKTYSLSRISKVKITYIDADIDKYTKELRKALKDPFGIFIKSEEIMELVELQFSRQMSRFAQRYVFHPEQKITENKDGTCNITFSSYLSPELTSEILKFGDDVKVIKPDKLKNNIIEKLKSILKQY